MSFVITVFHLVLYRTWRHGTSCYKPTNVYQKHNWTLTSDQNSSNSEAVWCPNIHFVIIFSFQLCVCVFVFV